MQKKNELKRSSLFFLEAENVSVFVFVRINAFFWWWPTLRLYAYTKERQKELGRRRRPNLCVYDAKLILYKYLHEENERSKKKKKEKKPEGRRKTVLTNEVLKTLCDIYRQVKQATAEAEYKLQHLAKRGAKENIM